MEQCETPAIRTPPKAIGSGERHDALTVSPDDVNASNELGFGALVIGFENGIGELVSRGRHRHVRDAAPFDPRQNRPRSPHTEQVNGLLWEPEPRDRGPVVAVPNSMRRECRERVRRWRIL